MNKAALWLGAAGLAATMVMTRPASAAEMFADVPTDHWAYQAVNNLQERGIVIGYPDGTFGGKRAMTRYEFAVAIDRLVDWVNRSMADLENRVKGGQVTTPSGPSLTEDQVRGIVNDMLNDRLKNVPTREDLETIRRLTDEFRDELAALGTNVETLRRDLDSLKARVGQIEERLNKWQFTGEGNFIGRGERANKTTMPAFGTGRHPVIDINGRTDANGTTNILQDLKLLYSLDFGITGNLGNGITANALLNFGNYLPWVNSNRQNPGVDSAFPVNGYASDQSGVDPVLGQNGPISPNPLGAAPRALSTRTITQGNMGTLAINDSYSEVTPVKLYLNSPVRDIWFIKDIDATLGKFGVQFTPYTLRKVDPDYYTNVTLTDNGEYVATGGMARATIAGINLQGYAATHYVGRIGDSSTNTGDPIFSSWGGPSVLSPLGYGAYPWDQSAGVRGTYQLNKIQVGGTYILAGVTPTLGAAAPVVFSQSPWVDRANPDNGGRAMVPRRAQVYGGDLRVPLFKNLAFAGEFASSDVLAGIKIGDRHTVFPTKLRNAYDAKLSYGVGRLSIDGGYQQVDPFFGAPGAWDRIGRWWNPTNIKGWKASAGYNFGNFTLKGGYADYKSVRVDLNSARGFMAGVPAATGFAPNLSDAFENKIRNYTVGLSFNLTPSNSIDLGYEQARTRPWDYTTVAGPLSGKTKETYWNIGVGHRFGDNTLIKVMYQIVDYKDNGAGLYTVPGGSYKGGIGVTQLSVRF